MTPEGILRDIYKPYSANLPGETVMQTWNSDAPIFERLIRKHHPKRIIEVGTFLGGSAVRMAGICRSLGLETSIICIDTWLGGIDHLRNEPACLRIGGGLPRLYDQFETNVVNSGFQDCITPFPMTSKSAAKWLRDQKCFADIVYLDASHEADDVLEDANWFSGVTLNTGVMFGDDWQSFPSVREGVCRYCSVSGMGVVHDGNHWELVK